MCRGAGGYSCAVSLRMKIPSICLALLWTLVVACAGADPPQRVLMIYSFGRDFAPFDEMVSRFRTELARQPHRPVEFVEASLEMARFDGADKDGPLLDFLKAIFDGHAPDLIVPVGAPAAMFCHRHRAELFPQTPSLIVGADKRRLQELGVGEASVAVGTDLSLAVLLENILGVLPETRHIHLLMGTSPLERFWDEELKREWPALAPQVTFHWHSDQSVGQMCATLRQLPEHSAIFVAILNRDAAGIPHLQESALAAIHEVAGAPTFGCVEGQFGLGIVGGRLLPMKQVGEAAARAGAELLAGRPPSEVRGTMLPMADPVYDWRELQRWGIPESRLPVGSTVLFRPPGLWQTHRTAVLVAAAVIAVQTLLILLLMAARRRARESDAGLRLTAEAASLGLWDRQIGGPEEIHASPEWRAIFGLPVRGLIRTEDVFRRIHPDDLPAVRDSIEQAVREGRNYDLEHRIVLPDGTVRWVTSRGRADRAAHGQGGRTRGVSMDITARKLAEAEVSRQRGELAHLSRVASLGELSGALAHELNQPLGSILSNAQAALRMLAREPADLDEVREILADIVSEDRRAGDVIKRLRALLKRGETLAQPLDINECIDEVLALVRAELVARGVSVVRDLAANLPPVTADRVQIQQVFLNLVANACDAMDARPADSRTLTLRSLTSGDGIHVEVRDTGPGFQEPSECLFQPFHSTKSKGLGMGLAICRTIMDAHHGRLWAEPCPEGGAVFHLVFPAVPPA